MPGRTWGCLFILLFPLASGLTNEQPLPTLGDLTIVAGRTGRFYCAVHNLEKYKVAWAHYGPNGRAVLSVGDEVLTKNPRIQVKLGQEKCVISVSNATSEDMGKYVCIINSATPQKYSGTLKVVVPPTIQRSSEDVTVREGSDVSLECSAAGAPTPVVTWKREDRQPVAPHSGAEVRGSRLNLTQVTRKMGGAYLCVASNGIPPPATSKVILFIAYPPVITTSEEGLQVWVQVGQDAVLRCDFASWPRPTISWTLPDNSTNDESAKNIFDPNGTGTSFLILHSVTRRHFGQHRCSVANDVGRSSVIINLKEIVASDEEDPSAISDASGLASSSSSGYHDNGSSGPHSKGHEGSAREANSSEVGVNREDDASARRPKPIVAPSHPYVESGAVKIPSTCFPSTQILLHLLVIPVSLSVT